MKLFAIIFSAILAATAVIYGISVRNTNLEKAAKSEAATLKNLERMAAVIPQWVELAAGGGQDVKDSARTQLTDLAKTLTSIGEAAQSTEIKQRAKELAAEATEAVKHLK